MTAAVSRHDHFPRHDGPRRERIRRAASHLDARWRDEDGASGGLRAAMAAVAGEPPAVALAALMPWLADPGWLARRLDEAAALLAADPFAVPPLPPVGDGLLLAEHGPIQLTLRIQRFEWRGEAPAIARFVPGAAAVRFLATGGASIQRHRVAVSAAEEAGVFTAAAAAPCRSETARPLVTGECLIFDTARESFTLADATGDIMFLELAVQPASPLPVRAYDVASGRLVHLSSSRRDASFRQMGLALLRAFGRRDAAPLFAAEIETGDFAARWAAMRELIALDPAAALPHLAHMAASDPHPEIRRAAAATLALYSPPPAGGKRAGVSHAPPDRSARRARI
ncbi:HEAT repeat domain-containing protein [Sphingopyxis sp. DBS4]|uniref:HEAT repeat domain-containing protein n=1 Tax=Sphingopyxis sp. DBS4 TaxID=2968500 RepID=UPI00214CF0B3|nr:HEAT repeat domain-containing protein [Sphingopyxis sp. DBS4]